MNIDKTVVITLDTKEVYLLKSIARYFASEVNDMFRSEKHLWDLTFPEMHEMDDLARTLVDL